jgi:hypothetical protein
LKTDHGPILRITTRAWRRRAFFDLPFGGFAAAVGAGVFALATGVASPGAPGSGTCVGTEDPPPGVGLEAAFGSGPVGSEVAGLIGSRPLYAVSRPAATIPSSR